MKHTFFSVKGVDRKARRMTVIASDETIDRYGEIIRLSAWKARLADFKNNPVFLSSHMDKASDGRPTIIGKVVDLRITKDAFIAEIQFAETPLADEWWTLYRDGFAHAVSVGFIGHASEFVNMEEGRIRVYTDAELLEISAVSIGANPNALSRSGASRTYVKSALGELRTLIRGIGSEDDGSDLPAPLREIERSIRDIRTSAHRFLPGVDDELRREFEDMGESAAQDFHNTFAPVLLEIFRRGLEQLCRNDLERILTGRALAELDDIDNLDPYEDLQGDDELSLGDGEFEAEEDKALEDVLSRFNDL